MAAEGRDGDAFPIELTVSYGFSEDRWESMVGDAKDVGISHVCVNTMSTTSEWAGTPPPNLTRPAEHIAALAKFIAQVG